MSYHWIRGAMVSGMGELRVKAITGNMFVASIIWKGHRHREQRSGEICRSFEEALESLDKTLEADGRYKMAKMTMRV